MVLVRARTAIAAGVAAIAGVFAGCSSDPSELQSFAGPTMGSTFQVKWHGRAAAAAVQTAVGEELAAADRTFSIWHAGSEIAAFNAQRSTAPFAASAALREAVGLALELACATDGAFDPTVKPLCDVYRAAKRDAAPLDPAALAAAQQRIGWMRLHVAGDTLVKDAPDLELDLDGIVAGFCADRIAARLSALGVQDFMLDITGEILCRGRKPDGSPWSIGITDPERAQPGREEALITVPLLDRALCTSGDYRNFLVTGGKVFSHVFDPHTGSNPEHGVVSVSVLARSCALADGLGTALMVLGPEAAAAALQRCGEPEVSAWFVLAAPDGSLRGEGVGWPEAFAVDGRPLPRPALAAEQQQARERDLAAAAATAAAAPGDVDATVWLGRRLGYLNRFRDAIAVYTRGLDLHPDEPRLLRHRGHRRLTVRDFVGAERDLARAAEVLAGKPDETEPDGQPQPGRPPHSTLQYNVHYHLGLARWCRGDFAGAEAAWRDCLATVHNDESLGAVTHWLWCVLMRQHKTTAADAVVAPIRRDLDVVENRSYYRLCRLYRGDLRPADLAADSAARTVGSNAALAFGLAHFELVRGDRARAEQELQRLADSPDWHSFGVIAAEVELRRRTRD